MTEANRPIVRRKITYFILMLALLVINTFVWRGVTSADANPPAWTVAAQAKRLDLTDLATGEADLTGSAVRLLLTGSRGLALATLWYQSDEKKKKHEWNKMEVLVNAITKLQPHSPAPWTYQSWNIAYNVSVESDRVKDKYFYIAKGLELMAKGIRLNKDQPDLRYMMGFYYQNKFGVSDEHNTLRSLFQMSCIDPRERDAAKLRRTNQIDMDAFEEFVRKHPMLVRRLKEKLGQKPDDIVDFLRDNRVIPSRFYDPEHDRKTGQKPRDTEQFPTLPVETPRTSPNVKTEDSPLGDDFWNFAAARSWFAYAQDPLPEPEAQTDLRDRMETARKTGKRIPRAPALVIFRHLPARAQSFIGEYFEKEGWFDDAGWDIDRDRTGVDRWFLTDRKVPPVGAGVQWAETEWSRAYQEWEQHGQLNGLLLDPTQIARLEEQAELYRKRYKVSEGDFGKDLFEESVDADMRESYQAHRKLFFYRQNRQMSNFAHHYYRALAEKDRDTIEGRKLFFEANRHAKDVEADRAMASFEKGFETWKRVLTKHKMFREDHEIQGDVYELQVHYMDMVAKYRGPTIRPVLVAGGLLFQGLAVSSGEPVCTMAAGTIYGLPTIPKPLPLPLIGPLDQISPDGTAWIDSSIGMSVLQRMGRDETPPPPVPADQTPPARPMRTPTGQ